MSSKPLVSVIIPTFNRKELLVRAVYSVLSQTYRKFEIIIVDDFSSDETSHFIHQKFSTEVAQGIIKVVRNIENKKNAESKNIGISHSSGDLVAFLDDDDIWLPDKLFKQVELIEKEQAGACFCATIWIEDGVILKQTLTKNTKVSFENGGPTSTWLVRKNIFKKIGYFDKNIPTNDEGELLVRLNKGAVKTCFVDEPLYVHFYYNSTLSNSRSGKIRGFEAILAKHDSTLNNEEKSSLQLKIVLLNLLSGNRDIKNLKLSIFYSLRLENVMLLFLFILPKKISKFLLNKLLDSRKYPNSFAERYS